MLLVTRWKTTAVVYSTRVLAASNEIKTTKAGPPAPQFHSRQGVEVIVNQVIASISSTITIAITPAQQLGFRTIAPDAHKFIYGE